MKIVPRKVNNMERIYRTFDGQIFDYEEDAERHEWELLLKNNEWENIAMFDEYDEPTNDIEKCSLLYIKTEKGYDYFVSASNYTGCTTTGITETIYGESIPKEKIIGHPMIWNDSMCAYIPLGTFLEEHYKIIERYEKLIGRCI